MVNYFQKLKRSQYRKKRITMQKNLLNRLIEQIFNINTKINQFLLKSKFVIYDILIVGLLSCNVFV